jgi:hypothetical protein
MIRTARILLAGLLHVLAAHVDVQDTYIIVRLDDEPDAWDPYYDQTQARIHELDQQARMN